MNFSFSKTVDAVVDRVTLSPIIGVSLTLILGTIEDSTPSSHRTVAWLLDDFQLS